MNTTINKILKQLYVIVVLFVLINVIMILPTYALGEKIEPKTEAGAVILKLLVIGTQVAVSGWFIIRFTINGIQYFISVVAEEKAAKRNNMKWTLVYGVLAFLAMYLFGYAVGLY